MQPRTDQPAQPKKGLDMSERDLTPEQLGAPPPHRSDWDNFLAEWRRGMAVDREKEAKRLARLNRLYPHHFKEG